MSNSGAVAETTTNAGPATGLSDDQYEKFWAGIVANTDAARRQAARFVSEYDVDDVVHSAAVQFIESLTTAKRKTAFPKTDGEFLARFLTIVRNRAHDCVRGNDAVHPPVHSHWGEDPGPVVGGRNISDRPLDEVFIRNDREKFHGIANREMREKDNIDELRDILGFYLQKLPRMQYRIIQETFYHDRKRAEVSALLGISVKTYDCHLQAAFSFLRGVLWMETCEISELDHSHWYDVIETLNHRYQDREERRYQKMFADESTPEGDASSPKVSASNPDGVVAA